MPGRECGAGVEAEPPRPQQRAAHEDEEDVVRRQLRALDTQAALSGNIRVIQGTGHIHAQTHEEDVVRRQLGAALPEISGVTIDVREALALALADNERRRST